MVDPNQLFLNCGRILRQDLKRTFIVKDPVRPIQPCVGIGSGAKSLDSMCQDLRVFRYVGIYARCVRFLRQSTGPLSRARRPHSNVSCADLALCVSKRGELRGGGGRRDLGQNLFRLGFGSFHHFSLYRKSASFPTTSARDYSYFNVCTGSSLAARLAGYRPASRLTTIENAIAAPINHGGRIHTASDGS